MAIGTKVLGAQRAEPAEAVVADAVAGDEVAFAKLVAAYDADMARLCFFVCGDAETAHDAVQAAWHVAWKKLASLRSAGSVRAWLMSVAANEARRLTRRQRQRVLLEARASRDASSADPATRAEQIDLAAALRRLKSQDREILALRYIVGFTTPEIARHARLSEGNVRVRISRALARLREELE